MGRWGPSARAVATWDACGACGWVSDGQAKASDGIGALQNSMFLFECVQPVETCLSVFVLS